MAAPPWQASKADIAAIVVAMGIAVIVTSSLGVLASQTADLLLGIGLFALARTRTISALAKLFLLLPPAVLFAAHTIWADDMGIRYMIPELPFAYLIGGLGAAWLIQNRSRWTKPLAVVLAAWIVIAAIGIYPDHLAYFNEAACIPRNLDRIGFDGLLEVGAAHRRGAGAGLPEELDKQGGGVAGEGGLAGGLGHRRPIAHTGAGTADGGGGELPATPGRGRFRRLEKGAAGRRGKDRLCAAVLQRERARVQQQHPDLSRKHVRPPVPFRTGRVLFGRRSRDPGRKSGLPTEVT